MGKTRACVEPANCERRSPDDKVIKTTSREPIPELFTQQTLAGTFPAPVDSTGAFVMKIWFPLTVVALTMLFLSGPASAQELEAHASATASNMHYAPNWAYAFEFDIDNSTYTSTPAVAAINLPGVSFTGLDRNGTTRTMHFNGNAHAKAQFRLGSTPALHTYVTGALTNGFYNPDNPPFFNATGDPDSPILDWDGVPDTLDTYANASFTEILQWGGTATSYLAYYQFRIHGMVTGDAPGYAAILVETEGQQEFWSLPVSGPGTYEVIWRSRGFPAGRGYPQTIKVTFFSAINPMMEYLPDGINANGTYDFGATISLEAIGVETETGGPVLDDWSVTADSGTTYEEIVDERLFTDGFEEPNPLERSSTASTEFQTCMQILSGRHTQEVARKLVRCLAENQ